MSVAPDTVAPEPSAELAALIGARICHDLVSPVGAIANGLELLSLGGGAASGPELQLVAESCASAQARLSFYRVAFGARAGAEALSASEAARLAQGYLGDTQLDLDWTVTAAVARAEAQLAFLGVMCAEATLPRGGALRVAREDGRWRLAAEGPRILADTAGWELLQGAKAPEPGDVPPAQVEFLLLALRAAQAGRTPDAALESDSLRLTI
jgi:histidine phosphotransferase ChpT